MGRTSSSDWLHFDANLNFVKPARSSFSAACKKWLPIHLLSCCRFVDKHLKLLRFLGLQVICFAAVTFFQGDFRDPKSLDCLSKCTKMCMRFYWDSFQNLV